MVGNTEKVIEDLQNQGIPKEDAEKYGDDLVVGNIGKFTLNIRFQKIIGLAFFIMVFTAAQNY